MNYTVLVNLLGGEEDRRNIHGEPRELSCVKYSLSGASAPAPTMLTDFNRSTK